MKRYNLKEFAPRIVWTSTCGTRRLVAWWEAEDGSANLSAEFRRKDRSGAECWEDCSASEFASILEAAALVFIGTLMPDVFAPVAVVP